MEGILDFFRRITGFSPSKDQKRFLKDVVDLENGWIILCCGRGTGKTLCCAVVICWFIFVWAEHYKEPIKILIVTPQARTLYDYIIEFLDRNPELSSLIKEGMIGTYEKIPLLRLKTKLGSIVRITKRATDLEVRGFQGQIVFIDEAMLVDKSVITAALGCVTGPMTKRVLLSTPSEEKRSKRRVNSNFIELVKYRKRKGWKLYNWSELGCSWISKKDLEKKKKNMSRDEYRAEVLGKIPLKSKFDFYSVLPRVLSKNPPIKEIGPVIASLDLSRGGQNNIALILAQKIGNLRKVLVAKTWKHKTLDDLLPEINQILTSYRVKKIKIDSRPSDLAEKAYKRICAAQKDLFNSQNRKASMLSHAKRQMYKGRVEISEEHKDLIKELRGFYLGKRTQKDLVDCLLMILYDEPDEQEGTVVIQSRKNKKRKFLSMH